ncbi:hypothetical protein [Nitrosomonas communis]|uniref:Hemolysin-type calcium-binding repeat-containing protein n=1 Tax=Nitrosomonas communis TaxID=44574 RepID=A0A1I4RJ17_9PROT|nr:hypothetical protein [Nitrosomonas communis]SFM51943.1 Hemolysin-type calcium-binding repeat-containing protein [Nitrosomonas communis]
MKLTQNLKFIGCLALALMVCAEPVFAKTLSMVAEGLPPSVTVFDTDTDKVLGTVAIPRVNLVIGDVLITSDQTRGFVTNNNSEIFVIDLTKSHPVLAEGTNPIPISTHGQDLSISPDGKFLLVVGGNPREPISVIDINAQAEINTFTVSDDADLNSLDVCSDGSVLVASFNTGNLYRLTLDGAGSLTNTGEVLSIRSSGSNGFSPANVYCASGGRSGVVIGFYPGEILSFTIPGLTLVDKHALTGGLGGISAEINTAWNRIFTMSTLEGGGIGVLEAFDYDPTKAELGAMPLFGSAIHDNGPLFFFGVDQMVLHPHGTKLYISQPNAINIYDTSSGKLLNTITDPNIVTPRGIAIAPTIDLCQLPPPPWAIIGSADNDTLIGTADHDVILGLDGDDIIDGRGGNDLICGGPGRDTLIGGAGDDTIHGGEGDDTISGGSGHDKIDGGDGNDTINGGAGNDKIIGGAGNDKITGGSGADIVLGNAGDDTLNVADNISGNDTVDGGTHINGDACYADQEDSLTNCNP